MHGRPPAGPDSSPQHIAHHTAFSCTATAHGRPYYQYFCELGWQNSTGTLHLISHFVGGDMKAATPPTDPLFFFHHNGARSPPPSTYHPLLRPATRPQFPPPLARPRPPPSFHPTAVPRHPRARRSRPAAQAVAVPEQESQADGVRLPGRIDGVRRRVGDLSSLQPH